MTIGVVFEMGTSADYKGLIRQFSLILFIVLALYLALVRPLAKQAVNVLQCQIDENVIQLEESLSKAGEGPLPGKESLKTLEAILAQEEQNYQKLANFIDPPKAYLPEGTEEAGLYFIEQLHITVKRLKRQANTLKINIPQSFGFSEEMPADTKDVKLLLKKLDLVDRVTTLLMEQGVDEISLIKPLGVLEQRDPKSQELSYRQFPVQVSFLCNSPALVRFLYQMKNFSPVLVVKDIIIKKGEDQSLRVELLLSGLEVT